jgi:hypothetical protein
VQEHQIFHPLLMDLEGRVLKYIDLSMCGHGVFWDGMSILRHGVPTKVKIARSFLAIDNLAIIVSRR